jgi:hypothetical protein
MSKKKLEAYQIIAIRNCTIPSEEYGSIFVREGQELTLYLTGEELFLKHFADVKTGDRFWSDPIFKRKYNKIAKAGLASSKSAAATLVAEKDVQIRALKLQMAEMKEKLKTQASILAELDDPEDEDDEEAKAAALAEAEEAAEAAEEAEAKAKKEAAEAEAAEKAAAKEAKEAKAAEKKAAAAKKKAAAKQAAADKL